MPAKNTPVLTPDQAFDVLDKAQQLITMGWVKGALAKDQDGNYVAPQNERAVAWCELGAIQAATFYLDGERAEGPAYKYALSIFNAANVQIMDASDGYYHGSAVPLINDAPMTEHAQVIKMFERAKRWLAKTQAVAAGKW